MTGGGGLVAAAYIAYIASFLQQTTQLFLQPYIPRLYLNVTTILQCIKLQ